MRAHHAHLFAVVVLGSVLGLLAAEPTPGLAQVVPRATVPGMFGERVLRQPLAPRGSLSRLDRPGLARSPSGMFLGRDAAAGSLMFPAMPWQYQGPEPWPPGVVPLGTFLQGPAAAPIGPPRRVERQPARQQAIPGEGEVAPAVIPELPAAPAGPDQWLRTMGGMAPAPTPVASLAAAAPTAVSSPATTAPAAPAAAPAPRPMPPPIQLGFAPPRSFEDPGTAVAQLIGRIRQIEKRSAITVSLENDTAVLRGRVATERDRLLVENIARFHPGIWNVRNELVVEDQPAPAAKSSGR